MVPHSYMRLKLPHIPRIISATILPAFGSFVLWATTACLIGYNLLLVRARPMSYVSDILAVFYQPFSAAPHEQLAKSLWNTGARSVAKQELRLAADLNPNVLGAAIDTSAREAGIVHFWQDTIANHPDYRDGYIQLAALSYAQGNITQALVYARNAQTIDPNNAMLTNLVKFISRLIGESPTR